MVPKLLKPFNLVFKPEIGLEKYVNAEELAASVKAFVEALNERMAARNAELEKLVWWLYQENLRSSATSFAVVSLFAETLKQLSGIEIDVPRLHKQASEIALHLMPKTSKDIEEYFEAAKKINEVFGQGKPGEGEEEGQRT